MDKTEEFFAYLNSLDDDYYFFLANTVLGKIPTPFHKPILNQKILSFLINEENKTNLFAALDDNDRRYISLILLTGRTSAAYASRFFPSDSYIMLARRLSNLRDRLILLREEKEYRINPVLMDVAQNAFDAVLLFGEQKKDIQICPYVDRNILFAVANLLISGQAPVREANTHHFIKSGKLAAVFPQFQESQSIVFYSALRKLLISAKAVSAVDGHFLLDRDRISALLKLNPLNLMIRAVNPEYGEAIVKALGILDLCAMDISRFSILLQIISRLDEQQTIDVLKSIECFGFIKIIDNLVYLNQAIKEKAEERSALKFDSDMRVSFFGEQDPKDLLYLFADVKVCDKLISYAITKDSFFRALENGLQLNQILDYLGSGPQPQFTLWEASFSRLKLYDGILVRCDADIKTMIERHPDLKNHILGSFSDDLILMRRSTLQQWQETLSYALDLHHLPIVRDTLSTSSEKPVQTEETPFYEIRTPQSPSRIESDTSWDAISDDLIEHARSKGCTLSEIEPLVKDRIIVSKTQIDKSFRYAGRITASGFDYNAKLSAIKGAIPKAKDKDADLLEIELPSETLIVQPLEIMKAGTASSVLRARVMPDGFEKSIPISSIFRVTVLKWTLR